MHDFCELFRQLDETTKTQVKLAALQAYFLQATSADAAWAVYILSGRRFKRLVKHKDLRAWGAEQAGLPEWLFEECYQMAGDLAETIALVARPETANRRSHVPHRNQMTVPAADDSLTEWIERLVLPLHKQTADEQRETLQAAWGRLDAWERFVFNKLITGGLRIGVSQRSVIKAVAAAYEHEPNVIAHRMMGEWEPNAEFFERLISPDDGETELSQPYPFCLAHPLQQDPVTLGDPPDWQVDWKWDGIRAQIIRRQGASFLWSRGEELLNERFPEFDDEFAALPDGTVLDGEIVGWKDGQVLPFGDLQKRINRKKLGKKILQDVPVKFIVFDVLECGGQDIRADSLNQRRAKLNEIVPTAQEQRPLMLSPELTAQSWEELEQLRTQSRALGVEGLMLKQRSGPYDVGRVTGNWWKWKIEPYTIDAVLLYAQAGHGRRASLYTDYTFALWDGETLVPFAKAYSGLTDEEIKQVDKFIKKNTRERFGPVRSVTPELVFELAFENIQVSTRHKSGIAVRFPRIHRWRQDKRPEQADTLDNLKALMPAALSPLELLEDSSESPR